MDPTTGYFVVSLAALVLVAIMGRLLSLVPRGAREEDGRGKYP